MPNTILDFVTANEIAAYWLGLIEQRAPYVGEALFPSSQKLGLDIEWVNGSSGLPVVLNLSAFDTPAVPRPRLGFDSFITKMPFFKESKSIDEELRQKLNLALSSNNETIRNMLLTRIFNDDIQLLEAARAQRERMRMSMLMTGAISIAANGQSVSYDYSIPAEHKKDAAASWGLAATDVMADLRAWLDVIEDDTGVRPTRGMCNSTVWNKLLANTGIRNSIFVYSLGVSVVSDTALKNFLAEQLGLSFFVNNKRFVNEAGTSSKYVADDTLSLFPEGDLGITWLGTTPEESDLLVSNAANVAIVDNGVAIATIRKADPVNVETKVSMICLPSFEASNTVLIADVS